MTKRTEGTKAPHSKEFRVRDDREKPHLRSVCSTEDGEKTLQKSLWEGYEFLVGILNALPCAVFCKDASGRYLGGNAEFHRLLGELDPSSTTVATPSHWPQDLLRPNTDAEVAVFQQGKPFRYETDLSLVDGSQCTVKVTQAPLKDWTGKTVGIVGTMGPDLPFHKEAGAEARPDAVSFFIPEIDDHLCSLHQEFFGLLTERENLERQLEETCKQLASLVGELNLAEEKERRRVSTELHDNVVQNLALAQLNLAMLKPDSSERAEEIVASVNQVLEDAIAQVRGICYDLSPPILYEVGLKEAIASLGDRLSRKHGFKFVIRGTKLDKIRWETKILLYQSVRELITNAVKHATPRLITAQLRKRQNEVHVVITNDGTGFHAGWKKGFGLANIRQRISLIGGWFRISAQTGGTAAEIMVPTTGDVPVRSNHSVKA